MPIPGKNEGSQCGPRRGGKSLYFGVAILCIGAVAGLNYFTNGNVDLEKKPNETIAQARERQADAERIHQDAEMRRSKWPNYLDNPQAGADYVQGLARKYGSDFNKLPRGDQDYLNGMTAGHGRELLRNAADKLKNTAKTPAADASALKVSKAKEEAFHSAP
jgi:hypothetical protein